MTDKEKQKTFDDIFGDIKPRGEHGSSVLTFIMGHPGVGKTCLAVSAQELGKCVLINFENRIAHIDETSNLRFVPTSRGEFREDKICSYKQFISFINWFLDNEVKANYIIIDTIDSMFDEFLKYHKPFFKDQRQAYGVVYDELQNIFKRLKDSGCNIICTSHVLNDNVIDRLTISLNEKLRNKINALTDNIFYYESLEDETRILQLKSDSK